MAIDNEIMTHLPVIGAVARPTIGWTSNVGHLGDIDRAQHVLLANHFPVIVLVLAAEAFVMIGVVGLRSGRRVENAVVEAADAARAGRPGPTVVIAIGFGVAELDQSGSTRVLRREHRVQKS